MFLSTQLQVLFVCYFLAVGWSHKTSNSNWCGVGDLSPEDALAVETDFRQRQAMRKSKLESGQLVAKKAGGVINVYYHIITDSNGNGFLSDTILDDQITVLNDAFSSSGFSFVVAAKNIIVNDTWYNMEAGEVSEYAAKRALRRGTGEDLNFYTANLANNLLGWATLPWGYNPTYAFRDGVVCASFTLPGAGSGSYSLGDTGTHEVGHWMGLYHTFQGGCSSPGDYVDDTPQVDEPNYGCPGIVDSCPSDGQGIDKTWNFMDYTNDACMHNFTAGQDTRMQLLWDSYRDGSTCYINCATDSPTGEPTGVPTQPTGEPSSMPTLPTGEPSGEPSGVPTQPTGEPSGVPTQPTGEPSGVPTQPTGEPSGEPSGVPTQPTGEPSGEPSGAPTQPTGEPSSMPTQPTGEPSGEPSGVPTQPTGEPSGVPTQPTGEPSGEPSGVPTQPTGEPSGEPSSAPTEPTGEPTGEPSSVPTQPTGEPSGEPSGVPTQPTGEPTGEPSGVPTQPTGEPSGVPTRPTGEPSGEPSGVPTQPTGEPSGQPTQPTGEPSCAPTRITQNPTGEPTGVPTQPTGEPSGAPTQPTGEPSGEPSSVPTQPTGEPSGEPSGVPTQPTGQPSNVPTQPTGEPSGEPSSVPTQPTGEPTGEPSGFPTQPTGEPSGEPSGVPTQPTGEPSGEPSGVPTQPTGEPSAEPSGVPTQPTGKPSGEPSGVPTQPTGEPSGMPTQPTGEPSGEPSSVPTQPTGEPSGEPSGAPTQPTGEPSGEPSGVPTQPTGEPSGMPTQPTGEPSGEPSSVPTQPTGEPSGEPSGAPTQPTGEPSGEPSGVPTQPTGEPSCKPTRITQNPTVVPSGEPSGVPTQPTGEPSGEPSGVPTQPTGEPSGVPTQPTGEPTASGIPPCTLGDRAYCNQRGECADTDGKIGCVCDDYLHYWPSEQCAVRHSGRELLPGQVCYTNTKDQYCSWLGTCNADGSACVCDDGDHRIPEEQCKIWHHVIPTAAPVPAPTLADVPTISHVPTMSSIPSTSPTQPQLLPTSEPSIAVTTVCDPGDRDYCNNRGRCSAAGDGCVCDDVYHYWSSEQCSTYHWGRELAAGHVCFPDTVDYYCNFLGVCASDGLACECFEPSHRSPDDACKTWHAAPTPAPAPLPPGHVCVPGDDVYCSSNGYCVNSGDGCACWDETHYWSSDLCSTYHHGPELIDSSDCCLPGYVDYYCSWMGECAPDGSSCICHDDAHYWPSDRCQQYHSGPDPVTPDPGTCPALLSIPDENAELSGDGNTIGGGWLYGLIGLMGALLVLGLVSFGGYKYYNDRNLRQHDSSLYSAYTAASASVGGGRPGSAEHNFNTAMYKHHAETDTKVMELSIIDDYGGDEGGEVDLSNMAGIYQSAPSSTEVDESNSFSSSSAIRPTLQQSLSRNLSAALSFSNRPVTKSARLKPLLNVDVEEGGFSTVDLEGTVTCVDDVNAEVEL